MKSLRIKDWKKLYDGLTAQEFLQVSQGQEKKGVLDLRKRAQRDLDRQAKLLSDWEEKSQPKKKLEEEGLILIGGMDEAGRGPLAGPVVASVVVLNQPILGLKDSKKLSPKKREELFFKIKDQAQAYGIGWASEDEIDRSNILEATKLAMTRALDKLGLELDGLLLDGNPLDLHPKEEALVGGDNKSNEIAAASILAKVTRDKWMEEMDQHYPGYGFKSHKGYGTQQHIEALKEFGPSSIHRKTFLSFLDDNNM